ncbi:MAG TPA: hypothetical protein PLT68_00490 [Actinomycetota bacterium]|nr:hypothetical protein [Actinomycetota bacterium]
MDVVRRTEHWFTRNGLPRFVDGYNSAEHIWTRALPVMVVIMVVQLLGELGFALFSGSRVLLVGGIVLAGLALLAAGIWSRVHRGYWFVPADRVGWPLLVGFLATGVVAEMVELGLHIDEEEVTWGSVAGALVAQALLLGAIYLVTRYALVSMTGWAVRQTIRSAADLYLVATKALPLLLIVLIVLFINAEVWQVAGSLDGPLLWTSSGLLLVFGVLVTVERTHAQIADLRHDSPVERVRESCRGTPMAEAAAGRVDFADPRLERPQRRNLLVSALATQTIQAAVIGLLVWLFFIVFGVVAITVGVQQAWVGGLGSLDILWTIADDHVLSRALLRVATFLGAFAAFYTAIYASSDPVYRASFSEDIGSSLQQAVDVRRVYLTVKQAPDA